MTTATKRKILIIVFTDSISEFLEYKMYLAELRAAAVGVQVLEPAQDQILQLECTPYVLQDQQLLCGRQSAFSQFPTQKISKTIFL
jgi:hypothetical protein